MTLEHPVDLEGEMEGDSKGDFKHDMERDLVSSSSQVRSILLFAPLSYQHPRQTNSLQNQMHVSNV